MVKPLTISDKADQLAPPLPDCELTAEPLDEIYIWPVMLKFVAVAVMVEFCEAVQAAET